MAKTNKTREQLAQMFIDSLSEGKLPWAACWSVGRPANAVTGKPYKGINTAILSYVAQEKGYTDNRWCTFFQAQEKGWKIRKGEKSTPVEYWYIYDAKQKKMLPWPEANELLKDKEYADKYLSLQARTYLVFNAHQIEGIPAQLELPPTNIDSIRQQRDTLLRNMNLAYEEKGSQAYYSPTHDRVTLPPEQTFDDTYGYACTFLHECGHATGHPSRLNRDLSGHFGTESYAKEELRAEIASAFTAQAIGLRMTERQLKPHLDLHKAYIQSWAAVIKDAPGELFKAIKDAEKISDYLIEKGEFQLEAPELAQTQQLQEPTEQRYQVVVYHHLENGFDEKLGYPTLGAAEAVAQGYIRGTMEPDGFQYDGAAVYDLQDRKYLRIYGDYPDEKAHAQVMSERTTFDKPGSVLASQIARVKAQQKAQGLDQPKRPLDRDRGLEL